MDEKKSIPGWAWTGFILAGVLAIALVIALWPRSNEGNEATAPEPEASETSTQGQSPSTNDGQCDAGSSDDTSVLDTAPDDTEWITTSTGSLGPRSSEAGPLLDKPVYSCFEHSAEGALYSASWTMLQLNDPASMDAALDHMVMPSPVVDEFRSSGEGLTGGAMEVRGYDFLTQSEDSATIKLLMGAMIEGEDTEMEITMTMEHDGSDWKLAIPESGDMGAGIPSDTSNYITWEA